MGWLELSLRNWKIIEVCAERVELWNYFPATVIFFRLVLCSISFLRIVDRLSSAKKKVVLFTEFFCFPFYWSDLNVLEVFLIVVVAHSWDWKN